MNVLELINLLEEYDDTLEIIIEGCDCTAPVSGVSKINGEVVIRREDGVIIE